MSKKETKRVMLILTAIILTLSCNKINDPKDEPSGGTGIKIGGVTWAKSNVGDPGTFVPSEIDYGKYYQWNNKVVWDGVSDNTFWQVSWDGGYPTSGQGSWDSVNDPCPSGWRVPTKNEFEALYKACFSGENGKNPIGESGWKKVGHYKENINAGVLFDDGKGNKLFLPASGYTSFLYSKATDVAFKDYTGYYWSSTSFTNLSYYLELDYGAGSPTVSPYKTWKRNCGGSIRCVKK